MIASDDNNNLIGYDSIAELDQGIENLTIEDLVMAVNALQEGLTISDADINIDDFDISFQSANKRELLKADNNEIDMKNSIADLPEEQVSDDAELEVVVESIINLDTTLNIQNVDKLYEKLKQSYSAHNSIEINASDVSSIDTATLQLLVVLKKDAVKHQKEVVFAAPSPRFIESAQLLGLLEILDVDS